MKTVKLNKSNIKFVAKEAMRILANDGIVIIPTDTVYVLAANAKSSKAVKKIIAFKGRSYGKGISVFLPSISKIDKYATYNETQGKIIKTLLPGKFTIVLDSKHKTAKEIEALDGTVGIRIIDHYFVNELTKECSFPVTATSANVSGKGPHYSIQSFLQTLPGKKMSMIDLIVDIGQLPKTPTSTVCRLIKDKIEILRKGIINPKFISKYTSASENETKKIAQTIYKNSFGLLLKTSTVVAILQGKLGSGKTVFAKGIGELFNQELSSPTFTLIDEYPIDKTVKTLYHLDLYRVESEKEILDLRLEQLFKKGNLLLIEWGERLSTFESLKKENIVFFMVQIEDLGTTRRKIKTYEL